MKRSDVSDRQALEAVRPSGEQLPPLDGLNYMENDSALQRLQHAGVPFKIALRKLEHLDDRGLIEYGVSLNYPWRTEKGEAELARLTAEDAS